MGCTMGHVPWVGRRGGWTAVIRPIPRPVVGGIGCQDTEAALSEEPIFGRVYSDWTGSGQANCLKSMKIR